MNGFTRTWFAWWSGFAQNRASLWTKRSIRWNFKSRR